jgi:Kef-type K+ transport system membrane component KefB
VGNLFILTRQLTSSELTSVILLSTKDAFILGKKMFNMDFLSLDIGLKVVIAALVGFLGGRLAKKAGLPSVSGYLIFGLILGPSFINFFNGEELDVLTWISDIALATIAFSIGSEFVLKQLLKVGRVVMIITLAEVVGAIFLVFAVMYYGFNQSMVFSLVIASMSAATAPAATLLVIRQYRAAGKLTSTILPVVALDDVYGIVIFGIMISIAKILVSGESIGIFEMIGVPILEIVASIGLGLIIGIVLMFAQKRYANNKDDLQVIGLIAIGLGLGLSKMFGLSSLLTNISIGTLIANTVMRSDRLYGAVNDFITPFYILFFTFAGASLDLSVLFQVGWMGIAYILARGAGKMIGAYLGAAYSKADPVIRNNLGLALLPQGGISIGLSVLVRQQLPEYAQLITTIIMFSVLIYETSGPIFAKLAIARAKEIGGMDKIVKEANA